jgi:hypothetical protein
MEVSMEKTELSINETSSIVDTNDKIINQQIVEEKAKMIKLKFEKLLKNKIDIDIKAILFALEGFEIYLTIPNIENNKNLFLSVEKCIKKDLELRFKSNYVNSKEEFWILYSYYVLFFINIYNRKYFNATRHLLKTFLTNPYIARNELFPYFYYEYFEPRFKEELMERVQSFPENPRSYTKGRASYLMINNFIYLIAAKKAELDNFIDKKCYNIALLSLDSLSAYKTIKSMISLQ